MTEILLNAILNLFSIQGSLAPAGQRQRIRDAIHSYLTTHLRIVRPQTYLDLYDLALSLHEDGDEQGSLEQAATIARNLRPQLPRLEQYIFLLRYLELASLMRGDGDGGGDSSSTLADIVAEEFGVSPEDVSMLRALCGDGAGREATGANLLAFANGQGRLGTNGPVVLARPDFKGGFTVLRMPEVESMAIVAGAHAPLTLDSIPLIPGSPTLLPDGVILRDQHGSRIYFNEVASAFGRGIKGESVLAFRGEDLDFRYPGSENGLHDFSFCLKGGALVGVMGVSGAGKSTLLSILNGQMRPDSGRVLVNGVDLHRDESALEGVIGYVPQDDLLFEDLTVFDNLYYSASLCMAHLDEDERRARVDAMLHELQQPGIRDLKVGGPLDKTISGGQRKRLNIALELIREPSILFVDEPTSGLSSSDSENVMSLLKAQAAQGRLVIVVIHQPSSRIYKMFDRLWVLDQGGHPIYDGNPLDAIVYFRNAVHQAGMDEYACPQCGTVNPEQLFEIVEARKVDDGGRYTSQRRTSPQQWHELYLQRREQSPPPPPDEEELAARPEKRLWRPGALGQLRLFLERQIKGRLANRQYLAINLLEPPLLALCTALISHGAWGGEYVFGQNANISTYLFISVVVALFLGMSVSAEEINRDRKILRREQFLHLSRPSYLASKAIYLALVAALQMALFAAVGNPILHLPNMFAATWTILFSCAMVSSILGLNISDSFRSAITIYILIPLLLVPQMMLGGAVVPLGELVRVDAGDANTPLVANMMPSRWGYEALVVKQYVDNDYMRHFIGQDRARKQAGYMADYHIPEVRALADYPLLRQNRELPQERFRHEASRRLAALRHELARIGRETGLVPDVAQDRLVLEAYDKDAALRIKAFLKKAAQHYRSERGKGDKAYLAAESALRGALGRDGLKALKDANFNDDLGQLVMNSKRFETNRLSGDRLVQLAAPIAMEPPVGGGLAPGAPLFVAYKRFGPWRVDTFTYDLMVLWFMGVLLYVALQIRLLPRIMGLGRKASLY